MNIYSLVLAPSPRGPLHYTAWSSSVKNLHPDPDPEFKSTTEIKLKIIKKKSKIQQNYS